MSKFFCLVILCSAFVAACASDPDPSRYAKRGTAGSTPINTSASAGAISSPSTAGTPSIPANNAGSVSLPAGSGPVGMHGALRVSGNRIVGASGQPVQLRGMSLFWTQWSNYYQANTVDQLADDWNASVVRAALGVENGGVLDKPDQENTVVTIVNRAIERNVYVIIDWHDHNAQDHQAAAIAFFTRMAQKFGKSPHVIFEIYNEPLKIPWSTVKTYAEAVIAAIRGAGSNNLVIVGTPNWSQDVDIAATSPITTDPNVAYTLHFYAATHKQYLRDKAQKALDAGIALFVTEWGACEASGNGALNEAETRAWLDFLGQHRISWVNWALNDKDEACSALTPSAGTKGPWGSNSLTASGLLVKPMIP